MPGGGTGALVEDGGVLVSKSLTLPGALSSAGCPWGFPLLKKGCSTRNLDFRTFGHECNYWGYSEGTTWQDYDFLVWVPLKNYHTNHVFWLPRGNFLGDVISKHSPSTLSVKVNTEETSNHKLVRIHGDTVPHSRTHEVQISANKH